MSNSANDKCFACGKGGHFAKDCEENECWKTDSDEEYEYVWVCECCGKEFTEEQKCEYHEKYCNSNNTDDSCEDEDEDDCESCEDDEEEVISCFRCGREGHYSSSCYASKHINGYYLCKR